MLAAPVVLIGATVLATVFTRPNLELQIDSCAKVDAVEVGRTVAIELRAAIGTVHESTTTQVTVGCRGPFYQVRVDEPVTQEVVVDTVVQRDYFEIRVDDPLTGKSLRRLVDLRREPMSAQPRLLGIAISELVRASWIELVVNPTPVVLAVEKVPAPAIERAVVERVRATATTSIAPGCGAMFYGKHGPGMMLGCGATVRASGTVWHAGGTADVFTGEDDVTLGSISTTSATAFLFAGAHATLGPAIVSGELGGRFGVMTVSGDAGASTLAVGDATTAAWGGPATRLSVDLAVTSWLAVGVAAEAGYALLGIEGNGLGDTLIDTTGFWVSPSARLVFVLP